MLERAHARMDGQQTIVIWSAAPSTLGTGAVAVVVELHARLGVVLLGATRAATAARVGLALVYRRIPAQVAQRAVACATTLEMHAGMPTQALIPRRMAYAIRDAEQ